MEENELAWVNNKPVMNSKTDQEHPRCTGNKKYDDSTFQKLKTIQASSQVPI